ncbi:MAG: outer membrane lipoprotein-sorting protein [Nitrospirae bacterium]|nr:outer membrane lipoprotein-sorting protein [Nitrospirota bacterium]
MPIRPVNLFSILLSSLILLSCAGVKPSADLSIVTDRRVLEVLRNKSDRIKTINAALGLKPATVTTPALDAYLSYSSDGFFRLVGLTPTGFTLFDLQINDNRPDLSFSDENLELLVTPGIIRESIDFYGSDRYPDTGFFIEDFRRYYVVNQLKSDGEISYPLRRWWIDKLDMVIIRKEIFSELPDRRGERLLEALYRDFRIVDGISTPFEIIINNGRGGKIGRIKFYKVEYNKD